MELSQYCPGVMDIWKSGGDIAKLTSCCARVAAPETTMHAAHKTTMKNFIADE
jgi:hypothetical protein